MPQPQNAKRIRPNMPHYGIMPDKTDGMLSWDWVDEQMGKSPNYWICTTRPDGRPHAVPVWGVWVDGTLYFGRSRKSVSARNVEKRSDVVVHLESGDDTVIIEGKLIESKESPELKHKIDKAYATKYPPYDPSQEEDDGSGIRYQVVPHKVMAWLEKDYPNTATYWMFDPE